MSHGPFRNKFLVWFGAYLLLELVIINVVISNYGYMVMQTVLAAESVFPEFLCPCSAKKVLISLFSFFIITQTFEWYYIILSNKVLSINNCFNTKKWLFNSKSAY